MCVPHAVNHLLEKVFTHSQLQDAGTGDVSIHILQIRYYSWWDLLLSAVGVFHMLNFVF